MQETALYQFEDGAYSDWSVSSIVRGPADVDLEPLLAEWRDELRAFIRSKEGDDDGWHYYADESDRGQAWGLEGPGPRDFWSDSEWFARWLAKRPGWELVPCRRVTAETGR